MLAVTTDPDLTPRLALREVPRPAPAANQALVKVRAISLNAGETRTALAATKSYVPGWDFAGVVEQPAADGSSPKAGARVFGTVIQGSWAEYVVARAGVMAETPDAVTDAQAACLPVAAGTALGCLEQAGTLLGRRVLVTGAAGGVGRFACQLAAVGGAKVFAVSRRPGLLQHLQQDGVAAMGVFATMADAKAAGEYDVIVDSVGGNTLALAMQSLAHNGVCVNCGNSSGEPTAFDSRDLYPKANTRLQSVWMGHKVSGNLTPMLAFLADLVRSERLHAPVDVEMPWEKVADAADRLIQQKVDGKIVLRVG